MAAIFAGFSAGALHALTGPDHLAALIPSCIGRHWSAAGLVGARWGLGHGLGAMLFGFIGFTVKGYFDLVAFSSYMEGAIGVTLILIGLLGYKEAFSFHRGERQRMLSDMEKEQKHDKPLTKQGSHLHLNSTATITMGICHGFTGTGHLVGVLPAMTMPSIFTATLYLGGFCSGTLLAIAAFTAVIGQTSNALSSSSSSVSSRNKVLAILGFASSTFAIILGCIWIVRTMIGHDEDAVQHFSTIQLD